MNFSLTGLNNSQTKAVETTEGVVQIVSIAGSGKTRVLTYRVANMIVNKKINSENILITTFSKKAADEMKERLSKLIDKKLVEKINAGTIHSIARRILVDEYKRMNHPLTDAFKFSTDEDGVISDSIKKWYIEDAMKSLNMNLEEKPTSGDIMRQIGTFKNELVNADEAFARAISKVDFTVAQVYKLYEERKNKEVKIDFDDMILKAYELLVENPDILKRYQDKFLYIMVDEAQDNNFASYVFIKILALPHNNIMIVGDDDQTLYRFRGARPEEFINFNDDFENAITIKLEINYRSLPGILAIASKIIKKNNIRIPKQLTAFRKSKENEQAYTFQILDNEDLEAAKVAEQIMIYSLQGINFKDNAVLFRTNAQTRALEEHFIKNEIPYIIYGGISFYELREVKDLVSYLRIIVDNDDNKALERVINVPNRYLGKAFMRDLKEEAKNKKVSLYKALKTVKMNPKQHKSVMLFMNYIDGYSYRYKKGKLIKPDTMFNYIIDDIKYRDILDKKNKDESTEDNDSMENLNTLLSSSVKYETAQDFIDFINKVTDTKRKDADSVQVMTIHKSKGSEFPNVHLVGMSEGLLPHKFSLESIDPNAIEDECRLAHVGITRAKDNIHMYSILNFNNKSLAPSRFLQYAELI